MWMWFHRHLFIRIHKCLCILWMGILHGFLWTVQAQCLPIAASIQSSLKPSISHRGVSDFPSEAHHFSNRAAFSSVSHMIFVSNVWYLYLVFAPFCLSAYFPHLARYVILIFMDTLDFSCIYHIFDGTMRVHLCTQVQIICVRCIWMHASLLFAQQFVYVTPMLFGKNNENIKDDLVKVHTNCRLNMVR